MMACADPGSPLMSSRIIMDAFWQASGRPCTMILRGWPSGKFWSTVMWACGEENTASGHGLHGNTG